MNRTEHNDRLELARRLVALTHEMLDLARAQDWPAFAHCERERREVSGALFATPVPEAVANEVATRVQEVLTLDETLIALAVKGRAEAAQALRDAHLGQHAVDTYRRFSF